jgi:DNA polymerase III delta subunit
MALKPVYALVGEDSFIQLQKLSELARQLPADVQRVDVDGERAELAEVLDELRSFAMFGGEKIVIVRNADEFVGRFREQLEKYVASPSNSATLVLRLSSLPGNQRIHKLIAKVGAVEKCEPPKDASLWIAQQARDVHKIQLSNDAVRLIADLLGNDLGRIDNELAKLALQCKGPKIGVADISGTVAFQREQEMWEMTNAVAMGKPSEAVKRWRQLQQMDSSAEFRAVTWLTMWLEDVATVISAQRRGTLPAAQRKVGWKYRDKWPQFLKTAGVLGEGGVGRALSMLAEVDYQSKTGVGEAAENVERFLLSLNVG